MSKQFVISVKCPHCEEDNNFVMDKPRGFGAAFAIVTCWNSEKQKGCQKEMKLVTDIKVYTDATDEQKDRNKRALRT